MTTQRNKPDQKAAKGQEEVSEPRTLFEAHQVLQKEMPKSDAPKAAWLAF